MECNTLSSNKCCISTKFVLAKFKFPIPGVWPRPNGKPPKFASAVFGRLADGCVVPAAGVVVGLADPVAVVSVLGARTTRWIVTPSFISIYNPSKRKLKIFVFRLSYHVF